MEGYTFVPLAVQPDAVLQFEFGALPGEDVPAVRTTRFFRWVPPVLPGVLYTTDGVRPNLSVDFMVVGYRPEALRRYLAGE